MRVGRILRADGPIAFDKRIRDELLATTQPLLEFSMWLERQQFTEDELNAYRAVSRNPNGSWTSSQRRAYEDIKRWRTAGIVRNSP